MKTKLLTLAAVACLFVATASNAQVPSYVPTNGLVGWWPFNGNANDESGNGNNGTVNGAFSTSDRFGNNYSAFNFNGSSTISLSNTLFNGSSQVSSFTISVWFRPEAPAGNTFALFGTDSYYREKFLEINPDSTIRFRNVNPFTVED